MLFKVSFYAIVGDCKKQLLKSDAMVRCRLRFPARAGACRWSCLLTRFWRASDARQKLLDLEELAVETERAGFWGAPEEAEMAAAPFCKHLWVTHIHMQTWQCCACAIVSGSDSSLQCTISGALDPMFKRKLCVWNFGWRSWLMALSWQACYCLVWWLCALKCVCWYPKWLLVIRVDNRAHVS